MDGAELFKIVAPALVAGFMIASIHGPLGIEVLRRGIIFIDLAIAQIVGLCVLLVNLIFPEGPWLLQQLSAVGAALLAAWFFRKVEIALPKEQEPIIGACFVLAASGMLIALASHPHGGEAVQDLLAGQILFVSWQEIAGFAPLYIVAFVIWFCWPQVRQGAKFFVIFALVITASVQLSGVFVVFASLILPALAVRSLPSARIYWSVLCGWTAVILGVGIAVWSDMPVGPLIVFSCAVVAIILRGFVGFKRKYKIN